MAYERGKRQGQDEAYAGEPVDAPPPPPPAPPTPAPSADDPASEIERLASLHDSGALSDEEFAGAKQKILGL